jgi:hypothetical protein
MRELVNHPKDAHSVAVIAVQLAAPSDPQDEHFKRAISILEAVDYFVCMRYREMTEAAESTRRTFEDLLAEKGV